LGANRSASCCQLKTSDLGTTTSDGPSPAARRSSSRREQLHRLAEPHVVGQAAAHAELPEEVQPAQPLALVRAQLAGEARRRLGGGDPLEAVQLAPHAGERLVDARLGQRLEEHVEQARLRAAKRMPPSVSTPSAASDACWRSHSSGTMPSVPSSSFTVRAPVRSASSSRGSATRWPPKSTPASRSNQSMPERRCAWKVPGWR
jgi:hypothetical protein